jgi:AcrR family transcriptional regulator
VPKLVDHGQRRAEIISANLRIIARDGLAGATMRALAAELGVANGAVGHYFKNQDELLQATYEEVFARTNSRAAAHTEGLRGLGALMAMLREMLPMEELTLEEARIVVCFWGRVTTDTRLLVRLPDEHLAWCRKVGAMLSEATEDGDLRAEADPAALAELLVTTVHAMQVRAVTLPDNTSAGVQRGLIEQILLPWLAPGRSVRQQWPADVAAIPEPPSQRAELIEA